MRFTGKITKNVESKISTAAILYFDLSKAFDSINKEIWLKRLSSYGIRGTSNDILKSYFWKPVPKSTDN